MPRTPAKLHLLHIMNSTHTVNPTDNRACIDVCNRLLRGELSAVETYGQTLRKFDGDPAVKSLRKIQSDHEAAAGLLRENVLNMGGEPSKDSGAWGAFAQATQEVAKVFGESAALRSLQQGEAHGLKDYTDALDDEDVMPKCKTLIRTDLLLRTRRHLDTLKGLAATR